MRVLRPKKRCVICGSTNGVQMNHYGGRNHVAWFMGLFCTPHHDRFHVLLRQAGVDLTFTHDPVERVRRALQAIKVAEWMLLEQLKESNRRKKSQRRDNHEMAKL